MLNGGICWLLLICVLTIFGNVLVILSVLKESCLHSSTYYYYVSLSLADLCVGIIVIPLSILFELLNPIGYKWLCIVWHISDVGASTASIFALCVISVDRYIVITSPINYHRSFIKRYCSFIICGIWLCSGLIAGPIVIFLGEINNLKVKDAKCEFPSSRLFLIVSSLISFYIPLLIMIFVYGRILISARKQLIAFHQGYKKTTTTSLNQTSIPKFRFKINQNEQFGKENVNSNEMITLRIHKGKYCRSPSCLFVNHLTKVRRRRNWSQFNRQHKATKVLGFIMGVFIACWLPFFLFILLTGICNFNLGIYQKKLFTLFTWLGYTNSALNFFVYALTSKEFRLAFVKLLCSREYIQRTIVKHSHQQMLNKTQIFL